MRTVIAARTTMLALASGLMATTSACGDTQDDVALVEGVTAEVLAFDNTFRPERIDVAAGTTIVWDNRGRNDHNVLPVEGDGWGVDRADFGPGDTYRHRFNEPGTFAYYCSLHGTTTKGMVGTVVVTG